PFWRCSHYCEHSQVPASRSKSTSLAAPVVPAAADPKMNASFDIGNSGQCLGQLLAKSGGLQGNRLLVTAGIA
ncbi:MAG: hypothetical protein WCG76_11570, partial [Verrucomicrobiota bacterium]